MDFETWIAPVLEGTGYRVESFTGERAVIVNGERRIEIWFRDPWCIEPAPKGKPLKMYMVPHHAYLGCYCYKCIRGAIMQMDKLLEFFGYKAENPTPPLTEEDLKSAVFWKYAIPAGVVKISKEQLEEEIEIAKRLGMKISD